MATWIVGGLAVLAAGLIGHHIGRQRTAARMLEETESARAELARRVAQLLSLQELSYLLSESLEPGRIIENAVRYASQALNSDGTMVALTTDGEAPIRIEAAHGSLAELAGEEISEAEAGLIAAAIGSEHLEVAHADDARGVELMAGHEVRVAAVAPLRAHGITVGAVASVRADGKPYSADDLKQLSTVANHTAVVLENARFLELIKTGKEQWEATFDALADGLAVLDGDGNIRRANNALAAMLDCSIPAVIGERLCNLLLGRSHILDRYLAAIRSGESLAPLTTHSDIIQRTLSISAAAMPSEANGWVVARVEDVTDRKAVEAQLIQSEKMAAIGQLVSGVAHELNNPLSSIAGLSDFLLSRESTSQSEKEHLSLIHEQAERAGHIVRNLLTFARKGPGEITDVDINEIARSVAGLVSHDVKLRDIDLELNLEEPPPRVRGDRHELQQVALNLITNAIQAVRENQPDQPRSVEIATRQQDALAQLSVADTGPGIPAEHVANVFLPFFTTKEPSEGTGLGLSISYRIVERHRGKIAVQHRTGGGTEFRVSLPALPATDETDGPTETRRSTQSEKVAGKRSVLLVDDDAGMRHTLGVLLRDDGHTVQEANAKEAPGLLRGNEYDLVIAEPCATTSEGTLFGDVFLAGWPQLRPRTLLLTADVRPETDTWLRELGCRYAKKPINSKDLRAIIASLLATPSG